MKDIAGFEGLYAITTCGRVWSYRSNKFLKSYRNSNGYHQVSLCNKGQTKRLCVHKLVAEAYIPNPNNLPEANHLNENKDHNYIGNLEWISHKDNQNYGTRNERISKALSKPVYCVELDRTFDGLRAAEKELGISHGGICHCLKNRGKTAGGYHWKYADSIAE